MAIKLGIDLGSTYTTISAYNPVRDDVVALKSMQDGSSSIPSVLSINRRGDVTYGAQAQMNLGKANRRYFETFKMFLVESNEEFLRQNGYDEEYTPYQVTKLFLDRYISGIINNNFSNGMENADIPVDSAVICVPEVWFSEGLMPLDGRNKLRRIVGEELRFGGKKIENVRVVSEPEAASAYFAYEYRKRRLTEDNTLSKDDAAFEGVLLIIDYGGGTLDITLSEIRNINGNIEVKVIDRGGRGANHCNDDGEFRVGDAGKAYINEVVSLAISDCPELDKESLIPGNAAFESFALGFENWLKSSGSEIKQIFKMNNYQSILSIPPENAYTEDIDDCDELTVTYQHMYQAYKNVIAPVLESELKKINKTIRNKLGFDPCDVSAGDERNFKIAMVGGFSNFHLVQKQLTDIYNFDPQPEYDMRLSHMEAANKCEAISFGAALLAEGKVGLKKLARYSLGLVSVHRDKNRVLRNVVNFAIMKDMEIEPNTPYFILSDLQRGDMEGNRLFYCPLKGNINDFAYEKEGNPNVGFRLPLKEQFCQLFSQLPDDENCYVGFGFDNNDMIQFYVATRSGNRFLYDGEWVSQKCFTLNDFSSTFELSNPEVVSNE